MNKYQILTGVCALALSSFVQASTFTVVSPTSEGAVISGVTEVGGIVVDLIGLNGNRIMSQVSASSLHIGGSAVNPLVIGTQLGFNSSLTSQLGGGISEAAFRFTLWNGDSAPGNFDDAQQNELLVNGIGFGYWGETMTHETDSVGFSFTIPSLGFADSKLETGWFYSNNTSVLSGLFSSIQSTESIVFALNDIDPGDNYFDFRAGIDGSLINVGMDPTLSPIPEPSSYLLMLGGLGLVGFMATRRRRLNLV